MAIMAKRWRRSRQTAGVLSAAAALCLLCCVPAVNAADTVYLDLNATRRSIEKQLVENLEFDKGKGCVIPKINPFSRDALRFEKRKENITCKRTIDWVKCYHSQCRVVEEIKKTTTDIECTYQDIIYNSDLNYTIGPVVFRRGSYLLDKSDHVKVSCKGTSFQGKPLKWSGNTLGFRTIKLKKPPPDLNTFNVLIFGFDSASRNGFIRRMPKSWKVLTEELGATVMEGYNIVGATTSAAIIPILTGHTEVELPEARKIKPNARRVDAFPFIFYKLKQNGYRTAYFEDLTRYGTFQFRLKGWRRQPADHYLRPFFLEELKQNTTYCVGGTPKYKLMMNITEQFMALDGKRFVFTFIGDITHDDFNIIQTADEDMAAFLRAFRVHSDNTLLVVMGDHAPRSFKNKQQLSTLQGKFEERQPLMALRLPTETGRTRPAALAALQGNARALTTPHDLHATLLDVLGMTQHWNPYRVPGADLPRALTLLEPIPLNRSCSEAGIEPHWCACVTWQYIWPRDPLYNKAARAVLDSMNKLVEVGSPCVPRTLRAVEWVRRERPNSQLLAYSGSRDYDGFTGLFGDETTTTEDRYQVKMAVGPGRSVIEASTTYDVRKKKFLTRLEDIVNISSNGPKPVCKHLNIHCYCRKSPTTATAT